MVRTLVAFVVVSAFVLSPPVDQREPLQQQEPRVLAQSPWPCPKPCPWGPTEKTQKPKSKKVKKEHRPKAAAPAAI